MLYHRQFGIYSKALSALRHMSDVKSDVVADAFIAYDEAINT